MVHGIAQAVYVLLYMGRDDDQRALFLFPEKNRANVLNRVGIKAVHRLIQNEQLDLLVVLGQVPDPLGVDAAVGGGVVRHADVAARRLLAEAAFQQGEVRAVLLRRRNLGDVVDAVDADGVQAVALAIVHLRLHQILQRT